MGGEDASTSAGNRPRRGSSRLPDGARPEDELARVGYVGRAADASVAVRRDDEVVGDPGTGTRRGRLGMDAFTSQGSGISYWFQTSFRTRSEGLEARADK